jgi:glyoxylase-like metal-dependent hydrolase (beta-lactamase superfamily II)
MRKGKMEHAMQVNDDLYILKLPFVVGDAVFDLNLSLLVDGEELTLVDAGLPDQEGLIAAAIEEDGFSTTQLKRIIITHQDMDHVGSLFALKEQTNATVLALDAEVSFIDGSKPSPKMPPKERLDANPAFAEMIRNLRRTPVDQALTDGEILDIVGGVRAIATPGHTPGHMSLYLERTKTIIAGDALTADNGRLNGPMPIATPDMVSAMTSVRKLGELDVETIVCYHGGIVDAAAKEQLRRVGESA